MKVKLALVNLNKLPPEFILNSFILLLFSSKAYGSSVAPKFTDILLSNNCVPPDNLTGLQFSESLAMLYEVEKFKLFKITTFLDSVLVLSLSVTFASRLLLTDSPIELEKLLLGEPKIEPSNLVYSNSVDVCPSASTTS